MARTALNYELLNQGFPPLLFSSDKDKKDYLCALEKSYLDDDRQPFYTFMLKKMSSTSKQAILILRGQTQKQKE